MRLIDADALKVSVPDTSADIFENCRNCKTLMDWEVKELIDQQPTASPWHRVEDELPKDRETVLIYCENTGGIVKSLYHEFIGSGGKKHCWFSGGTHNPKYWMPLPEPPKEDA